VSARPSVRSILRPVLRKGHFAFFRGVLQGLAARVLWARYLAEEGDVPGERHVHRMTAWIRSELMAAATRAGQLGRAHLLRLHLAPLADTAQAPTLAEFIARHDLDGFAESEQQALYAERYPAAGDAQRRRARLLARQLWAVHTAEAQLCQPVSAGDACRAWFVDTLAARLAQQSIVTLGDLHARMRATPTWWQPLAGIGAGKARAMAQFVAAHAASLGALPDWPLPGTVPLSPDVADGAGSPDLPPDAATPAEVAPSRFAPLERLILPGDLSGRAGRFRAPPQACLLDAQDDLGAVRAWLAAKAPAAATARIAGNEAPRLSHTQLAYRREAERLLLWAILVNRTALSSLTVEACTRFRDFLLDPPADWCGPRAVPRWHSHWRCIEGPLSARSCRYALAVLHNLFAFLVKQGYLLANPWPAVHAPVVTTPAIDTGRALTERQWQVVRAALAALPPTLAHARLRLALRLLYESALRLSELLGARTGDLAQRRLAQPPGTSTAPSAPAAPVALDTAWWLTVRGKGGKLRRVPLSGGLVAELGAYLVLRGLPADPRRAPDAFLIGSAAPHADPTAGVSGQVFHTQLKAFFRTCAEDLAATDPQAAATLLRVSTHWLRHTSISHALAAGAPAEVLRDNAGHASLHTTSLYIQVEDTRRVHALLGLWQRAATPADAVPD